MSNRFAHHLSKFQMSVRIPKQKQSTIGKEAFTHYENENSNAMLTHYLFNLENVRTLRKIIAYRNLTHFTSQMNEGFEN